MYSIAQSKTHIQDTPSNIWTITHNVSNLSSSVVIDVYVWINGELTKILPLNIKIINETTVEVSFSNPHTGIARLV